MNKQKALEREATVILNELNLLEELSRFGEARVVGSVALGLIVKLDIDVHVLIEEDDLFPTVEAISRYLLDHAKVREVRLTDWRQEGGIKIGVDAYPAPSGTWSIDIWVTNQVETCAFAFTEELLGKLTDEHRETILKIKEYYHQRGELRDGLSLKIYRAVVDEGIEGVEGFSTRG